MDTAELLTKVTLETSLNHKHVSMFFDSFIKHIRNEMLSGESIKINGLGTFDEIMRPERNIRSLRTGEMIHVPESQIITFAVDDIKADKNVALNKNILVKDDERLWNLKALDMSTYETDYSDAVIDLAADMIVSVDAQREVKIFNKAAEKIFGYTQDEVHNHGISVLYANQSEYEMVGKQMREKGFFKGEITSRKKNGEEFPSLVSAVILRDKNNVVMGSVGYSRDLTEERAAAAVKQELAVMKMTENMKKDIEAIVRHDLKSPINGIIGFTELLLSYDSLSEDHKESISLIKDLGYRTINMINLSLGMLKMEKGTYPLEAKSLDIISLIKGILSDINSQIKFKSLSVNILLNGHNIEQDESCLALGEELLSYSMFANLLKNSVEAVKRKQSIDIQIIEQQTTISVAIHNMGAVPEAMRNTFFDKFATSGKSTGTGLGTYSARLIAETQNGQISMHSSEEEGTTITVILPKYKSG